MKKEHLWLFEFIAKQLDGYLLPNEAKDFVLKKYGKINQKDTLEKLNSDEINRINENLTTLGWIEGTKIKHDLNQFISKETIEEATKWANSMENGKVINNGLISNGAGFYLDILDERGGILRDFTFDSIESLLKYVEVKRKKILSMILKSHNIENDFLQWIDISILFCRTSRRHKDLRFLNAALKMNDFFFLKMKNEKEGKPLLNFLLALTEQEISAAELLQ
jgi:hypothetical protein